MTIVVGAEDMAAFLDEVFPQVKDTFGIDHIGEDCIRMRLFNDDRHLRPGGTVSGPAMFGLADVAAYVATMSRVGKEALAVTTNVSIDFMRKPAAGVDLIARGEVLKLGKSLAVIDVRIFSEGVDAPVARATLTYSIPPARS